MVVRREGGEEEGERRRRGLCLEETRLAPFPRPFWNPSGALIGPFGEALSGAVLWQEGRSHHDHGRRRGRLVLSVIFVMCAFCPCPLNPEEPHACHEQFSKMKIHWLRMTPFLPYTSGRLGIIVWGKMKNNERKNERDTSEATARRSSRTRILNTPINWR